MGSNTIPIFGCCNQAFPCVRCHGFKYHPPKITAPSQRYCVRCLKIYEVGYPQTVPVNCVGCME